MNARERQEFDRMNAMPRKTSGKVDYYYKPQTKYPPRIYVFMHAETWCDRNRRPMGLFYAYPFLSRPMNKEEIEYHHFDTRLCYHQYEDWDKLLYAEEKEAAELDKENTGTGTAFLEKLAGFRKRYTLGNIAKPRPRPVPVEESQSDGFLAHLLRTGAELSETEVSDLLIKEQQGEKRLPILILLRELYKNSVLPEDEKSAINQSFIDRKVKTSEDRSRRNFARRVYAKNKLFALQEIRERYPSYDEETLAADLLIKTRKVKRAKRKPIFDLRRCQLEKLAAKLRYGELDEKEYHDTCCRIALLQQSHDSRVAIPIAVTFNRETLVYHFDWRTRENIIKSFVGLANQKGMTHQQLGKRFREITSSGYSF